MRSNHRSFTKTIICLIIRIEKANEYIVTVHPCFDILPYCYMY